MAGLTSDGFEPKTLAQIIAERQQAYLEIDPTLNVEVDDPQSEAGREIAIESEREALLWELAEALHNQLDLNSAGGVLLDELVAVTGTRRKDASPSSFGYTTTGLTITGTAGTVIPDQAVVATSTGVRVAIDGEQTIPGSGTLTEVPARAVEGGPTPIAAGALTIIEASVPGWSDVGTVTNPEAAALGTDVETDAELRTRTRNPESNSPYGRSPYNALLSELLAMDAVEQATIVVNASVDTDADGRPPFTFEVVVYGSGIDYQAVADAIWRHQTIVERSTGTDARTVTDVVGETHTVYTTDAQDTPFEVTFDVTVDADVYPADGDAQLLAIVKAYYDELRMGGRATVYGWISLTDDVPGIVEITTAAHRVKGVGSFVATPITANPDQKPLIEDDADITITSTPVYAP